MGPIEETILTVLFLIGSGIILLFHLPAIAFGLLVILLAALAFGLWP